MPTRNQKSCWFGLAGSVPSHLERLCVVCDTIPNSTKRSYIENCSINRGVAIVTWASCLWCRWRWQWNSGECMQMFMLLMILVILKPTAKENKEKTQENGGNDDESPRELHAQWGLNGTKRELSQATLIDKLKLKLFLTFTILEMLFSLGSQVDASKIQRTRLRLWLVSVSVINRGW